ncbi:hypothetical protein TREPR_0813 [Treponema primitia ZAS-2]|uniref:DUF91 domain-containing protein n=1 Tax=Treponema primitia (strain ATCC BAA-887 / DSM 12427 / ZAS-2) TaxID=545694 RepID=F5YIS9_TREPZ|nr:hypothetical protein [Treponema primitia]AEF87019.1 hypothetical protein TREPR_0813 [Treponema primitia ZAS-2]
MGNITQFEKAIADSQGKPGGFPRDIHISFTGNGKELHAELVGKFSKKDFRRFDPWILACIAEAKQKYDTEVLRVNFRIDKPKKAETLFDLNFESLRRRISFLSINNPNITFTLSLNKQDIVLYDETTLFHRPDNEVIHTKVAKRSDDDKPGLLEKSFQAFLYGKGLETRTNDRLAILGEDFYQMKGKDVGVLREFPTGVFNSKVSESTRIMPTEAVDIVTLNKLGNLAVIELKLDNSELEVISQILDYGLYFSCYRDLVLKMPSITEIFDAAQITKLRKVGISCYVVNNYFHPRFDDILRFYSIKTKDYGFYLKKVVLGATTEI